MRELEERYASRALDYARALTTDEGEMDQLRLPSVRDKLTISLAAAISTTSWLLAAALGTSQWLAAGGWAVLTPLVLIAYSAGILSAFFVTFVVHFAFVPDGPAALFTFIWVVNVFELTVTLRIFPFIIFSPIHFF